MKLKHIVRFQILEYLKGFYIYKASLAKLDAMTVISGAFGVFNKKVLFEVGGYRNTIGEDIDITLRFQEYILKNKGKKMLFVPEAVCYTECPENWRDLFKQRVRWEKAFVDRVIQYRSTLVRSFLFRYVSFIFVVDAFFTGTVSTYFAAGSFSLAFSWPNAMELILKGMIKFACLLRSFWTCLYSALFLSISLCMALSLISLTSAIGIKLPAQEGNIN